MVRVNIPGLESWGTLAEVDEEERESRIREIHIELAGLSETDLAEQVAEIVRAESDLSNEQLLAISASRLRVWLAMDEDSVKRTIAAFEAASQGATSAEAMRRVSLNRRLHEMFSVEERRALVERVPTVFAGVKKPEISFERRDGDPGSNSGANSRKRWWPFGGR